MPRSALSVTLTGLAWLASAPLHADPTPVAVFDMSFINFSQEVDYGATNEAEHARIAMLNQHLRERLDESGRFRVVDPAPVSAELAMHGDAFTCNHCEAALARKLGAGLSITGAVQKMSVLVQTVILRERDSDTGEIVALYQTDIRGNTDIAWKRGLDFLIDNRLLTDHP
ncbi:conserved hypothetical protein, putative [Citreicella sp. SE45]|uniref:DUF2380 domain-containing protein n=1 Tax=Salipiger thiooxidans TaxID=282683 RepID=A0A1G7EYK0_9RHOB|nr:DUF3280 domain-containing protein [Salipiger thiooxidans]EEX16867.1 conserved hypothetical protein, putative [Citreicella sp. SE45]SDE68734.1 Protein of unknown function [Salipiger thiooxidans]